MQVHEAGLGGGFQLGFGPWIGHVLGHGAWRILRTRRMVKAKRRAVHYSAALEAAHAPYPQVCLCAAVHSVAITCAQIAIMPRNTASDASAAASSKNARNMFALPRQERTKNIVHFMFRVKWDGGRSDSW